MDRDGAVGGLRVVEIGRDIAVPYAAKLLGDLGADVVKVEFPGLDPLRSWGTDPDGAGAGALFRFLNGGKAGHVLDPARPEGRASLADLVRNSDVVLEDLGPSGLERLGLDPSAGEPSALPVVVRVSDFGQDGPDRLRPASALTVMAAAGWIGSRGLPDRPPVMVGGRLSEYAVGSYAAAAAMIGLEAVRRTGRPAVVDVSAMECVVSLQAYPMLLRLTQAPEAARPGARTGRASFPGIMSCKDGLVGINALTGQHWQDMCALLDLPEYADRQYDLRSSPDVHRFFELAQAWLDQRTVDEVLDLGQAFRVPVAPVCDGRSMLQMTQLVERASFVPSACGSFTQPAAFCRMSATPPRPARPAPIDASAAEPEWPGARREVGTPDGAARPFDGLRVVDFTTFWSGPIATSLLGALGADVVKVESCVRPDGFRFSGAYPSQGERWYERSGIWQAVNLNKRDVSLDLSADAGRDVVRRLIARADVVIENFSPRVLENFGLDEPTLRAIRPDVVVVRMPGYGLSGPWRDYVGWAMAFEQAAGLAWVTGYPDGPPLNPGGAIDPIVGMHALTALLSALDHRRRTGVGQLIEVPQIEVAVHVAAEQAIEYSASGRVLGRDTNRDRRFVQGVYRCSGEDQWVAITIRDDKDWAGLGRAIGQDWSSEARFATPDGRIAAHDELDDRIERFTAQLDAQDVVARLGAQGVPVAEVVRGADLYGQPHLESRGFFEALDHELDGTRRYPVFPMRFSFLAPPVHQSGAPTLGEHTDEVLAEAGLSPREIAELAEAGVTGTRWRFESEQ